MSTEFLWWIVAFAGCLWAGDFCNYSELYLSKKWKNDRLLNRIEGACYAYALVCAAMAIIEVINAFAA